VALPRSGGPPPPPGGGTPGGPSSSGIQLSAQAVPTSDAANKDAGGMVKFIWGTSIVIQESMDAFDTFLREFKIKYRLAYDRRLGVRSSTLRGDQDGETLTYVNYLRLMRQTGEYNLNLDTLNLKAYPPTKKLYHQLCNYPQEMVPVMDQVLKDCMLKVAEADMDDGHDDMQGELGEEELRAIGAGLYKVRPFGAEKEVNMRDLNPGGA
jgi:DNA replication licensing factor MCM4